MEVVNGHAMNSPLLQLCAKTMLTGEHAPLFMLQHMEKDARLADELAKAQTMQQGKPLANSMGEVRNLIVSCKRYAETVSV